MRTTVTLDPDVAALLKKAMRERGISFKEALNNAVRDGLSTTMRLRHGEKYRTPTFRIGFRPEVNLVKALQLAAELEDEEIIRKMMMRK
jgi:hypothetical protein